MQVVFQGEQNTDEVLHCLLTILHLFKEHYGIDGFCDMRLQFNMLDKQGDIVDLIDPATQEVYGTLEVQKAFNDNVNLIPPTKKSLSRKVPHLRLVVDNTKK